ncbi:MAG: glycoside hydrolase family 3 N-terminal domain-containing protein [Solirubrobacteraceae bacterium]
MRLSRDPAARRRLLALAALAALAALVGLIVGASSGSDPGRRSTASAPATARETNRPTAAPRSLDADLGELIMLRFAGTSPPAYVTRALREHRTPGAILFRDNIASPVQLRDLTRALQSSAGGRALVATDQEGGPVRNVASAGPAASATAAGEPAALQTATRDAGRQLRALGVNVDLAPVADVPSVAGAALAGRAYARDPAQVSAFVGAAVRGYTQGGVAATAKHFPGLGGATTNTDQAPVDVSTSLADLRDRDLPPFAAAVRAGVPLVMVGHARYPTVDPAHIASQSPRVYELLRGEVGFRGVAVTDSLEARAVIARSSVDDAGLASIRAGADLLLTTGRGSFIRIYRRLRAEARHSATLRTRIGEAADRVRALQDRLQAPPPGG